MQTDWQGSFAKALLHPEEAVPHGLCDPHGNPTLKRFAVYRNNVISGLTKALKVDFPAVCRIVGEDFFAAMARTYIADYPPRSPVLLEYGQDFATFIDNFNPVASLPYLGDVARIERAWLEAYHESEATPVPRSTPASVAPEYLHDLRFHLHPSGRLIRSKFPALTIWSTNIEGGTPTAVDLEAGGENVLMCRPVAEVEIRTLSNSGAEFIRSIAEGNTVRTAAGAARMVDCSFDPLSMVTSMIAAGAFAALQNDNVSINNGERGHHAA